MYPVVESINLHTTPAWTLSGAGSEWERRPRSSGSGSVRRGPSRRARDSRALIPSMPRRGAPKEQFHSYSKSEDQPCGSAVTVSALRRHSLQHCHTGFIGTEYCMPAGRKAVQLDRSRYRCSATPLHLLPAFNTMPPILNSTSSGLQNSVLVLGAS